MVFGPAPLSRHPKETKAETEADICILIFISASFTISQKMEASKYLKIKLCGSKM